MISNLDDLTYEGGYPTAETTQKLYDQLDLQRQLLQKQSQHRDQRPL